MQDHDNTAGADKALETLLAAAQLVCDCESLGVLKPEDFEQLRAAVAAVGGAA